VRQSGGFVQQWRRKAVDLRWIGAVKNRSSPAMSAETSSWITDAAPEGSD
jgi:hypothetical protein